MCVLMMPTSRIALALIFPERFLPHISTGEQATDITYGRPHERW